MESFSTIDLVLNNYRASLSLGDYNVQVLAKLSTHDIMRVADRFKSMPSLKYSATLFGHRALFRHRHRTKAIGGTNKKCTDFGRKKRNNCVDWAQCQYRKPNAKNSQTIPNKFHALQRDFPWIASRRPCYRSLSGRRTVALSRTEFLCMLIFTFAPIP